MEMAWCSDHALPYSSLLRWSPEDRARLNAYLLEKAGQCQSCGTSKWEWDPEQGGSKFAYEAVEEHCQGCLVKEAASEDSSNIPGSRITLVPKALAQKMRSTPKRPPTR